MKHTEDKIVCETIQILNLPKNVHLLMIGQISLVDLQLFDCLTMLFFLVI